MLKRKNNARRPRVARGAFFFFYFSSPATAPVTQVLPFRSWTRSGAVPLVGKVKQKQMGRKAKEAAALFVFFVLFLPRAVGSLDSWTLGLFDDNAAEMFSFPSSLTSASTSKLFSPE